MSKFFVEIGSCDFDTLNELADYGWGGVIVEPVSKYLNSLTKKPGVRYLNVAIDSKKGTRPMFVVDESLVQQDHDFAGMTSFYNQHGNPVNEITVETITYSELIERGSIQNIDYLKIDTEGHDWEILKDVILDGHLRPKYIKVEHKHCDSTIMTEHLENHNYRVFKLEQDLFAICNLFIVAATNP